MCMYMYISKRCVSDCIYIYIVIIYQYVCFYTGDQPLQPPIFSSRHHKVWRVSNSGKPTRPSTSRKKWADANWHLGPHVQNL